MVNHRIEIIESLIITMDNKYIIHIDNKRQVEFYTDLYLCVYMYIYTLERYAHSA